MARPRLASLSLFLLLAALAILGLQLGQRFFPGERVAAHVGRLSCSIAGILLLVMGSRWLLRRDGLAADRLGLEFRPAAVRAFLVGAGLACVHILVLMSVFCVVMPFEIDRGTRSVNDVMLATLGYLGGNFVEELLFRGYLLVALAHWLGTSRALWVLAVPFGLFHFPGLGPEALLKMMLTTGAMHFVYAYVFLATRSLWAAVAMHAVGNTLLHEVIGIGNPAVLSPHFLRELDDGSHAPFLVFFGVSAATAVLLSRLPATRRGAEWLGSSRPVERAPVPVRP